MLLIFENQSMLITNSCSLNHNQHLNPIHHSQFQPFNCLLIQRRYFIQSVSSRAQISRESIYLLFPKRNSLNSFSTAHQIQSIF